MAKAQTTTKAKATTKPASKTRAVKKPVSRKPKAIALQLIEKMDLLEELGWDYVIECTKNTKETVSASGRVVELLDRQIPTIDYFLRIWIPMKVGMELMHRRTWYKWLKNEESEQGHTIKEIDLNMKAVAESIVANEGKGIFYAKNRLGMHDRQQIETKNVDHFDFDI
jgi:hypothetical protein